MYAHHHEAPDKGIPHDQHHPETHQRRPHPKSTRGIYLETLGEHIEERRNQKKLTQEKLAKQAGISVGTVRRVEKGLTEPTFATLYQLSKTLGFPITIKANP